MNHEEALNLLPAYVDKELSLSELNEFERHLNGCDECQRQFNEQMHMSKLVKSNAIYFEASSKLANRIEAVLPINPAKSAPQKSSESIWNINWLNNWAETWGGKGMLLASMTALIISASLFLAIPTAQDKLIEELTASHIRSLQANHLSDVISTDQHTVKPWFNGKLDYSPPIVDLASTGFPMEGGRLDYINGKTVAVVIYRHNKHPINLFVCQSNNKDSEIQHTTRNGFNLVHWENSGMNFWAISDLETGTLLGFAQQLRQEVSKYQKS